MSITERFVTGVDRAVIFSIACEIDDREGKEGDGDGKGLNPRETSTARTEEEEEGASATVRRPPLLLNCPENRSATIGSRVARSSSPPPTTKAAPASSRGASGAPGAEGTWSHLHNLDNKKNLIRHAELPTERCIRFRYHLRRWATTGGAAAGGPAAGRGAVGARGGAAGERPGAAASGETTGGWGCYVLQRDTTFIIAMHRIRRGRVKSLPRAQDREVAILPSHMRARMFIVNSSL